MAAITESVYAGEVLLTLSPGNMSIEKVTLTDASGNEVFKPGTVLGVVTASGKYTIYNSNAADGTETAAGVLIYEADPSAADVEVAIVARLAEVKSDLLQWHSAEDAAGKTEAAVDLAALNIFVR